MQNLRTIGVENGALLVSSDDGTHFRLPIDEALQSRLRQNVPEVGIGRKLAPRDIQAHIRSGMSAQDVAAITGAPLDYIQRFEGPVIDEREFIVQSALQVIVNTGSDFAPTRESVTFGTAIRERLHDLGGAHERWASWKEVGSGWIIKLSFTANQIDHDARWQFDPKKHALAPLNSEAITLSQQGEAAGTLMPRLRAVKPDSYAPDQSRFDSGAFAPEDLPNALRDDSSEDFARDADSIAVPIAIGRSTGTNRVDDGSASAASGETHTGNQTADLLDALRRRRGEREAANFEDDDSMALHPSTGSIRIVEVPMETFADAQRAPQRTTAPQPTVRKKGRAAMPSWDEIVFGARADDDLG